jgi:D-3-phosphoglycerate dehydrogenase
MKKIFITDYVNNPDIEKNIFGNLVEVCCGEEEEEKKFNSYIYSADAILVWHAKITEETVKQLKKCKVIVKYGTGYDNIDTEACAKYGIPVCNTPDYGVEEVCDTACAMILASIRQIVVYDYQAKHINEGWQTHNDGEIKRTSEHSLGIIGMGRMGTSVALRMKAFGMKVSFFDPYLPSGYEKAIGVTRFETLNELLKNSSIISIHTPLTKETTGIIDKQFIDNLNAGTILVNTARGKLVKNLDLILYGLESGKLSFVGLDVLPEEPPNQSEKLIAHWKDEKSIFAKKILINPHSAYYSTKSWVEMRAKAANNINNVLCGANPKNRVA